MSLLIVEQTCEVRALARVRLQPGDVVRAYAGTEPFATEALQPVGQGLEVGHEIWVELGPAAGMLFRPEEVHTGSAPGTVFRGPAHLTVGVAHDARGVDSEHLLVAHLDHQVLAAVQTRGIHANRLAGKQPAYRQRLKASLGKPPLLAVDADAVLRRQVVEGRKGDKVIRLRV